MCDFMRERKIIRQIIRFSEAETEKREKASRKEQKRQQARVYR